MKIFKVINLRFLFIITAAALFLAFLWYFLLRLSFPEISIIAKSEALYLNANQPIEQKFQATRENLSAIKFLLRDFEIKQGDRIKFYLAQENCGDVIAVGFLRGGSIDADNYQYLRFDKITGSKGKTYCFGLVFEPADPGNKKRPRAYLAQAPDPSMLSLYDRSQSAELSGYALAMKPAYKNLSWRQDGWELIERMSQYKPWFLKGSYLAAIIGLLIVLSFACVIILLSL